MGNREYLLPVEQCDREILAAYYRQPGCSPMDEKRADKIERSEEDFGLVQLVTFARHRLTSTRTVSPPIVEDEVERVARAIAPNMWARFDNATRPYIENRGAGRDGEQHWYALTYKAGCRSAEDVRNWFETCDAAYATWDVHEWRESWVQARAAIAAMDNRGGERAQIVAWLDSMYTVNGDNDRDLYILARKIERGDHMDNRSKDNG